MALEHSRMLFLVLALVWGANLSAQDFEWASAAGGSLLDSPESMAVDLNGNVYTVGRFSGTSDFDPGPATFNLTSNGEWDIFIQKLDADGNFLWAHNIGSTEYDRADGVAVDSNSNIYVTGSFGDIADFDPGPGTYNLGSSGDGGTFVLKLDSDGNFVWANEPISSTINNGKSIAVDEFANVYITGYLNGTADFDPHPTDVFNLSSSDGSIFIQKLDSSGKFIWAENMGGSSGDWPESIYIDTSGNIYTTGYFFGTGDFDPGPGSSVMTSIGSNDIFIVKLDTSGAFYWSKSMGSTDDDKGQAITADAFGNVYTTGFFRLTADFDPGPGTNDLNSEGMEDIFIQKLDSDGNFVWAQSYGSASGDEGMALSTDTSYNLYVTGGFSNTIDFDFGAGTHELTSFSNKDVFVLKVDSSGSFSWAEAFGESSWDSGRGIIVDTALNAYTMGHFQTTVDFDPGSAVYELTGEGSFDVFVTKWSQCLDTSSSSMTVTDCSSFTSPSGLHTWTSSGIYVDTLVNAAGCDSLITIDLTLNSTSSTIYPEVCDTFTSPSGNYTWNASGAYLDTIPNAVGCDSIITVNLTVNSPNVFVVNDDPVLTVAESGATYQWIDCDSGMTAIPGETNQSFTASANGSYAVIVNNSGCIDTSDCVTISTIGLDELDPARRVVLYPNPTTGVFNLRPNRLSLYTVEVRTAVGQLVYSSEFMDQEIKIDLREQPAGIYQIRLIGSEGVHQYQLVLE